MGCSRELETIVKDSKTSSTDLTDNDALTKAKNNKRKTSCAQQARNESDAVNLSIDILTDYLDEAILFPKKCPTWQSSCIPNTTYRSPCQYYSNGKRNLSSRLNC